MRAILLTLAILLVTALAGAASALGAAAVGPTGGGSTGSGTSTTTGTTPPTGGGAPGSGTTTTGGGSPDTGLTVSRLPAPSPAPPSRALSSLDRALRGDMRQAGVYSGAYVVDVTSDQMLFSDNATAARLPASVEKLYTTSTALAHFGPNGTLSTTVLSSGQQQGSTFDGTLYLRGGGDPTFGSAGFDEANYGTGATMQRLVANLIAVTGLRSFRGNVVADESIFDADRGTPATGNQPSLEVEGELSGLSYDRGFANGDGTALVPRPALTAGRQFVAALQAAGVKVPRSVQVTAGTTPSTAHTLASISSPPMSKLIALTNTPSDNFFAEMLLKDLGARFGTGGTTAAGAAVVRAQVATSFGIDPRLDDGSGLSRYDRTTPVQVVTLLSDLRDDRPFVNSLAIAGETGTLQDEMRGTYAQGRCRGKTGSLHDASNVVGYCQAQDGHTLVFALLTNGLFPDYVHPITDRMQVAIARYDG